MSAPRAIAVFDFDGTLIEGDSFLHFLLYAAGLTRFLAAFAEALIVAAFSHSPAADARTLIKERLMLRLLGGRKPARLKPAATRLRHSLRWKDAMRRALFDHHAQGHHIVVASGALDLYLPDLLDGVPHHGVICTVAEIKDGRITGSFAAGNCVRDRKAELLRDYIARHGPFAESFGYGNAPDDLPMLGLVKHRIIV